MGTLSFERADAPLAVAFVDRDDHFANCVARFRSDRFAEQNSDVAGQKLGRGVGHGQQHAILTRKDPPLGGVSDGVFVRRLADFDRRMLGGQYHAVVERVDNLLQGVADNNEIDDVLVFVEHTVNFRCNVVIMTMERFADVAAIGDKVRSAKNETLFGKPDVVGFGHGRT